jgi:outer membrane protein assembly factor BamB
VQQNLIIGSNGNVCAIDPQSGTEVWRTRLQAGVFNATHREDVSVLVKDGVVYAGSNGHVFALSATNGDVLWHNELKGLGFNDISLAFEGQSIQYLQKTIRTQTNTNTST